MSRTALLVCLALLAAGAAPPGAQAQSRFVVSIGDALAAGYMSGSGEAAVFAERDYTQLAFARARTKGRSLRLVRFGCPGDNTSTFQFGGCPFEGADPSAQAKRAMTFIGRYRDRIAYVTLSIGLENFARCGVGEAVDVGCLEDGVDKVRADMPRIARNLRRAAGRRVRIAQLLVYNPYLAVHLRGDDAAEDLALRSNEVIKDVNRAIRSAADRYGFRVADGYAALGSGRLNETTTYEGDDVPVAVAQLCKFSLACQPAAEAGIHPSERGYRRLGIAFIKALGL